MDPSFEPPQADVAFIQLPGARRSLASHHGKHDKKHSDKGKHHADNDEENDKDVEDSHNKHHADNGLEHSDKHAHNKHSPMTFEDAEGKFCMLLCCLSVATAMSCRFKVSTSLMFGGSIAGLLCLFLQLVYKQTAWHVDNAFSFASGTSSNLNTDCCCLYLCLSV